MLPLAGGSLTGDLGVPGQLNVGSITATGTVVLGQDPAAAMQAVTRQYADALGVPLGGTAGQILAKNSSGSRDSSWGSTVGLVVGNPQGGALGAGQLNIQVSWSSTTTPVPCRSLMPARRVRRSSSGATQHRRVSRLLVRRRIVSTIAPRSARGTGAAPAALQSGDGIGFFGFNGYGASGFTLAASIGAYTAEAFSAGHQGSYLNFAVTPTGSGAIANAMKIGGAGGGVQIGTVANGDPGLGSLALQGFLWLPAGNIAVPGSSLSIGTGTTGNIPTITLYGDQVNAQHNLTVGSTITSNGDIVLGGTLRGSGSSLAIGGMSGNIGTITLYANNTVTQSSL